MSLPWRRRSLSTNAFRLAGTRAGSGGPPVERRTQEDGMRARASAAPEKQEGEKRRKTREEWLRGAEGLVAGGHEAFSRAGDLVEGHAGLVEG